MDQTKTHWKKLINPDYIGAYALTPDEDLTVTIDYVQRETVVGTDGKKEDCTVAHLINQKPMILNVTNSKSIAKLYGPFIEEWSGKKITLYASMTKAFGDMVECLRIRPQVAKPRRPSITDKRLSEAIKSIKAGTFTVEKLKKNFELSDEQQKHLTIELENSDATDPS